MNKRHQFSKHHLSSNTNSNTWNKVILWDTAQFLNYHPPDWRKNIVVTDIQVLRTIHKTRINSSRMLNDRFSGHLYRGVYLWVQGWGGVSACGSRRVSVSGSRGVCLWVWGVCLWVRGGGECLPLSPEGCLPLGPRGVYHTPFTTPLHHTPFTISPFTTPLSPHPLTDRCKNITLPQTLFAGGN